MAHTNINDLKVAADVTEPRTTRMKWQPIWLEPLLLDEGLHEQVYAVSF